MNRTFLTNVNIFDGEKNELQENYTIVIEDGKIKELFPMSEKKTLENGKSLI